MQDYEYDYTSSLHIKNKNTNGKILCTYVLSQCLLDNFNSVVTFDVLTAVRIAMIFWVVTPYRPVGTHQSFGETYCLHLQG
jgi:hypothetical protein